MVRRPIFLGLLLLAMAALVSAIWLSNQWQPTDSAVAKVGEPLIEGLANRINEVTGLTLSQNDEQVELSRQDDVWGVSERAGYPADMQKLRSVLIALSGASRLEAKTANPDRYQKLGLADPSQTASNDVLSMTLTGPDGSQTILFGKQVDQGNEPRQYARLTDDPQSWLISGSFQYDTEASRWLRQDIIDLPSPQVIRVRISHPDGGELNLSRADLDQPNFDVDNLPEGRQLLAPTSGNSIASALGSLMLTDVRPSTMPLPDDVTVAEYTRSDGLIVSVRAWEEGDAFWITLSAREDQSASSSDADQSTPNVALEQADQINQRVMGWSYRIPSYKYANMTKRLDELLKPVSDDS